MLRCEIPDPAIGFVGEPVHTDAGPLLALRDAGIVPVMSSIGCVPGDSEDQLVNVNADTVAATVAAAAGASRLVFLTDIDGVRGADDRVIPELQPDEARRLIADGVATGGMIPKLEACLYAADLGVPAQIVDGRVPGALAGDLAAGTRIVSAH